MSTARRFLAHVGALAVAVSLAACGGGSDEGSGLGSAAEQTPASAALVLTLNTDFEGDQWQAAEGLFGEFPQGRDALESFLNELGEDGDFERNVKPAVGPEVTLAFLELEDDDRFVLLTQPREPEKFRELVTEGDDPGVVRELDDGWWAAAQTEETLDLFEQARGEDRLADSEAYEEATGELPEEALATAFLNGDALDRQARASGELDEESGAVLDCFLGGEGIPSLAFSLGAEGSGVRLAGTGRLEGREEPASGDSELDDALPGGALAFFSATDLATPLRDLLRCAAEGEEVARMLALAELGIGVSIEEDVLPLFQEETAVALYEPTGSESAQMPNVVLASEVEDEAKAAEVVDTVAARASAFLDEVSVKEVDVSGVQAQRITVEGKFDLFVAATDGKLVLATTEDGLQGATGDGPKLADDEAYTAAREAAGAPEEATGFGYVDVAEAASQFFGVAGDDVPSEAAEATEPLRSLFLWSEADGSTWTFEGFLEID